MLIAYRARGRAVFLYGFAKSEQENVGPHELASLREIAAACPDADAGRMAGAIEAKELQEVDMAKQEPGRLAKAIFETADGMHRTGIMDDNALAKITLRHLGKTTGAAEPISGEEIHQVREKAHLS